MSYDDTKKFLEACDTHHAVSDPFEFEDPAILALDAQKIISGGCTPSPTCGKGGSGTDTLSAAMAGGGIIP